MMNDQELFQSVETAVTMVLKTKPNTVKLTSRLVDDLGAESIDFLDISSELERLVNAEVDFKQMIRARREAQGNDGLDLTVSDVVEHLKTLVH